MAELGLLLDDEEQAIMSAMTKPPKGPDVPEGFESWLVTQMATVVPVIVAALKQIWEDGNSTAPAATLRSRQDKLYRQRLADYRADLASR